MICLKEITVIIYGLNNGKFADYAGKSGQNQKANDGIQRKFESCCTNFPLETDNFRGKMGSEIAKNVAEKWPIVRLKTSMQVSC